MQTLTIQCDADSARRFQHVAKLWPKVIGSQQTNILNDARSNADAVDSAQQPKQRVRFSRQAMAPVDTERLCSLATLWPELCKSKQEELLSYTVTVCGL